MPAVVVQVVAANEVLYQEEAGDGIAAYCNAEPACRDQLVRLRRSSGQVLFGTQTLNDENILSSFESQSAAAPGRKRWRMDASAQHT